MKRLPLILTACLLAAHASAQNATPVPAKAVGSVATPPAKPFAAIKYHPPKNVASGTRIDGDGGSRGGDIKLPKIYVLAPNHTGFTTHEQPSLFWYQAGPATTRFELTLVAPGKPKPLLQVGADKADQAGIHRLRLDKHGVNLAPGILYKWTVALVPDPANRSQDEIASGTIQRIVPDAQLAAALTEAKGLERAAVYADKGVWYDALEAVTKEIDGSPKDGELHRQRATLLEQADLKAAADWERQSLGAANTP